MSQDESVATPRSGAVKVINWLLLGQSLALIVMGSLNFLSLGVGDTLPPEATASFFVQGLTGSIIFVALACLGFVATFNFWRLDQIAWTMAMLTQGLMLLTALIIYFEEGPNLYAYIMMAYGIMMVIYLHLPDVIGTFTQTEAESQ